MLNSAGTRVVQFYKTVANTNGWVFKSFNVGSFAGQTLRIYFGVHGESNFRDLDTVAVGPVVRDASAVYDDFWNSAFAVPYEAFVDTRPTPAVAKAIAAAGAKLTLAEKRPLPR